MVVSRILLYRPRLGKVFGPALLLLRSFVIVSVAVEVASLSKVGVRVVRVVCFLNVDHSLILHLVNSLLSIDCWETYVLGLWVESKKRNVPVSFLVVPLRALMQFVKFVLRE